MVDAGLRARVDRLLGGDDFRVDDLTRLFLYARDRCDGRESVQEIGDFVAHHEQRNKGIITRETRDWFLITRVMVSAMQTPLQGDRLPPSFKEFLAASLRRIGPAIKRSGISLSKARRMLPAVLKKFEQNPDSTLAVSAAHSPNERELIKVLSSQITARPAFTAGKLFKDFGETLRSNGLLTKKEKNSFDKLKTGISLFAVSVMHNCTIEIGDDVTCKLESSPDGSENTIQVCAPVPTSGNPKIFMSSAIFSTEVPSKEHCEEALLASPRPWTFDLEVTSTQKLARLG